MINKAKFIFAPAVVAAQFYFASLAIAADDTSNSLEEVVVTATRRTERLEDVPISVSAFSQEKLDAQGLHNIDDLSRLAAGVAFQRNGMSSAGNYNDEGSDINIRGVDSTAGTSTTGIYIDDTPIQTRHIGFGSINAFPALFDLDRVEVLRGPQGTLFGAGAEGGVVRFIAPEANLGAQSGYFRTDAAITDGGSPSWEGGAAFGAPIIPDVLAFRASVSFRRDGGWVDRSGYNLTPPGGAATLTGSPAAVPSPNGEITQPNANYMETTTARLALKWKVTDDLEISPSLYYQRLLINDTSAYWIDLSQPQNNVYLNGNAGTNPSDDPFTLTALKIKWDLGFASLFSNTAYYDRNQKATSDYTIPACDLGIVRRTGQHLPGTRRSRLCLVRGQPAQLLPGAAAGLQGPRCVLCLERRSLLLAPEGERAREHRRSDAQQ
jgi:outer membrane receptor protein involved in Fe transport